MDGRQRLGYRYCCYLTEVSRPLELTCKVSHHPTIRPTHLQACTPESPDGSSKPPKNEKDSPSDDFETGEMYNHETKLLKYCHQPARGLRELYSLPIECLSKTTHRGCVSLRRMWLKTADATQMLFRRAGGANGAQKSLVECQHCQSR